MRVLVFGDQNIFYRASVHVPRNGIKIFTLICNCIDISMPKGSVIARHEAICNLENRSVGIKFMLRCFLPLQILKTNLDGFVPRHDGSRVNKKPCRLEAAQERRM